MRKSNKVARSRRNDRSFKVTTANMSILVLRDALGTIANMHIHVVTCNFVWVGGKYIFRISTTIIKTNLKKAKEVSE